MAGLAKPNYQVENEGKFTVIESSSITGSINGLFDGTTPNAWNTNEVAYWNTTTSYLIIEFHSDVKLHRFYSWNNNNNQRLKILKYNGTDYAEDYTSSHKDISKQTSQTWKQFTDVLPKGKYKFLLDSSDTGFTGRIDGEWYVETAKNRTLILHGGEYKKVTQRKDYSIFYNGTSSRMRTTKVHKYNVVTLETWIKPYTISSTNQDIMSNVENGGHSIGLLDGKYYARFYINGAYRVCYGDILPLNQWSHLATTFDGNIIKLYVNGTKVSELAYSGTVGSTSAIFSLGANPAATSGYIEYFNGELRDSRIWSVARTELQISKNMFQLSDIDSVSDNLMAWYPQSENTGTICKDKSQYVSDGTYYNTSFMIEYFPKKILTVSNSLPNATKFSKEGMDSLSPLFNRELTKLEPVSMVNESNILGDGDTGKVFTKTIDLKKYLDIRSIRTEVR